MHLSILDVLVFGSYFIAVVLLGVFVAARSKTKGASDYFLASKSLPWYAVGASFIAANISSEHFIGQVGWGFLYGMAVANWEWGNVFTFSVLLGVFLPFYMRGNVTTMPEFLERRYNKACRYIYAAVSIVGLVIALLAGVMVAGATAMNVMFPAMSPAIAVLILAVAAGIYTIYGGLLSAAWADVLQYCLLMIGGAVVTAFGLYYAGGFAPLVADLPEKFIMFYGARHEQIPWTGFVAGLFSVGIWYNCANQFMVQRCLGARSEWDARMGVIMAGFSKAFLPLIIAVPGVIAFHLFHDNISNGDQSWPYLVNSFLPVGMVGLVLAGLASAILSTLSAVVNSTANHVHDGSVPATLATQRRRSGASADGAHQRRSSHADRRGTGDGAPASQGPDGVRADPDGILVHGCANRRHIPGGHSLAWRHLGWSNHGADPRIRACLSCAMALLKSSGARPVRRLHAPYVRHLLCLPAGSGARLSLHAAQVARAASGCNLDTCCPGNSRKRAGL